jgi:HJR/Mrr/RecB family endonuclease
VLGLVVVVAPLSLWLAAVFFGRVVEMCLDARQSKRSRPNYLRYQEAVQLHELYQTTAKAAVHEAEQALLRKKRSYWEFLDGYAFERATAEVLNKHQFNPRLTPGSGDGGIDIEVTRNSLKGVVQCKAHAACVGPHVVRDLYGVIHHCGASFGIIVSRGGFTRGAVDFARDKPILFLDVSDLIAMQEGKDVLASAFSRKDSDCQ